MNQKRFYENQRQQQKEWGKKLLEKKRLEKADFSGIKTLDDFIKQFPNDTIRTFGNKPK